jgi:hypothetical protein
MQQSNWESQAIDLTHLGSLFVLDRNHDGRFYYEDFIAFAALCKAKDEAFRRDGIRSNIRAYCTMRMWCIVSQIDGVRKFVQWYDADRSSRSTADCLADWIDRSMPTTRFGRLFCENTMSEKATRTFNELPRLTFVSYDTVKTMHQILNIRESYGLTFQDFFALCRKASQEQVCCWLVLYIDGNITQLIQPASLSLCVSVSLSVSVSVIVSQHPELLRSENEQLEEYVLLSVVEVFAREFIQGFVNLMLELGYDAAMDLA